MEKTKMKRLLATTAVFVTLASPAFSYTSEADALADIASSCEAKWGTNFDMQVFCRKNSDGSVLQIVSKSAMLRSTVTATDTAKLSLLQSNIPAAVAVTTSKQSRSAANPSSAKPGSAKCAP
jgi:hypothetical protein